MGALEAEVLVLMEKCKVEGWPKEAATLLLSWTWEFLCGRDERHWEVHLRLSQNQVPFLYS